jgi:hypothetical protein
MEPFEIDPEDTEECDTADIVDRRYGDDEPENDTEAYLRDCVDVMESGVGL